MCLQMTGWEVPTIPPTRLEPVRVPAESEVGMVESIAQSCHASIDQRTGCSDRVGNPDSTNQGAILDFRSVKGWCLRSVNG